MADITARIEQFKIMSDANPKDELAFFSLGRAYSDNQQPAEAAAAFTKVIELNPKMSKAYQLLAAALIAVGNKEQAIETLKTGAKVSHDRGDFMPRNDMVRSLKEHGIDMPELAGPQQVQEVGEGQVLDSRTGQVGPRLPRPPFSSKLGHFIYAHVSAPSWQEWIGMGTKVINELRLPLSDPQAQKVFDQHMLDFLNLTEMWDKEKSAG